MGACVGACMAGRIERLISARYLPFFDRSASQRRS